jgi:hypothetical protein
MCHILVDPCKTVHVDDYTSFFEDLPPNSVLGRLVYFKHPARGLPVPIVPALDDKDAVLVVDDDAGDAHRVLGRVRHCRLLTFVAVR